MNLYSLFLQINQSGADDGTRTYNLLITNQLLYQLSYIGKYLSLQAVTLLLNTLLVHHNVYTEHYMP